MSDKEEIIKHEPARVSPFDIQELAAHILNMDEDSEYDDLEEAIYEKFDCSMETFEDIVSHLVPCASIAKSPISEVVYRGFSKPIGNGASCWMVKQEVEVDQKS